MNENRIIILCRKTQLEYYGAETKWEGSLFDVAPEHEDLEHLLALAKDRDGWRDYVRKAV